MKILDIIVLYRESTTAAAYLSLLKKNGYLPRKIIELDFPRGKKFELIHKIIGKKFAIKLFHLKNKIRKNSQYDSRLADLIMKSLPVNIKDLQIDPKKYCYEYQSVKVTDLEDSKLHTLLIEEKCKTFLFTGGGILKEQLLSIPDSKFIHIHPGIVPDVKGADGLFWSILKRKKPGYSCFYMNAGIDTGDILYQKEFDMPCFDMAILNYTSDEIYRGLLEYYDPVLRAITLLDLITESQKNNDNLHRLPYNKQNPNEGRTYFFMHPKLRNTIIKLLIKKSPYA